MQDTQEMQVRSLVGKIPWRRKWQPIRVLWPGESHGQKSLESYSSWDHIDHWQCYINTNGFFSLFLWNLLPLTWPWKIQKQTKKKERHMTDCFLFQRNSLSPELGFPGHSIVKNPPTNQRTCRFNPWVEKIPQRKKNGNPLQYSLSWEIPWTKESGRLLSMGSQKSWIWLRD